MTRCIVVATDGRAESIGAVRCGRDLAARLRLPLEVLSVCEPGAVYGYESADLVAGVAREMADAAKNIRRGEVTELLKAAGLTEAPRLRIEIGAPAATIARAATESRAHLIVIGCGSPTRVERMLGDETALRLMQAAHVPVLSAPAKYGEPPARALAAVDFTSYSLDAARSAAELLPVGAELHLVHVNADESSLGLRTWREEEWMRAMREEAEAKLNRLVDTLARSHPGVTVRAHLVEGRTVPAVLRLAEELEVEMLAAGTNGFGFLGRLLMGSVATQLVRRTRGMTLIAPPRGVVTRTTGAEAVLSGVGQEAL